MPQGTEGVLRPLGSQEAEMMGWISEGEDGTSQGREREDISCLSSISWGESVPIVKVKVKSLSRVRLFATPWTVAYQASQSVGFSREECWSGLPLPSAGDLPNPRIEARSPALQADS